MNYLMGMDIGGTKIHLALADEEGKILAEIKFLTKASKGQEDVLRRILASIEELKLKIPLDGHLLGLGVGVPGIVHPETKKILEATNLGWKDVFLRDILEKALNIPVWLDNDANLGALGEYYLGAGKRIKNLFYVTVSTGIGGGILLDGKIVHGALGRAGELGHLGFESNFTPCVCGKKGCLEALASGTAISKKAQKLILKGKGKKILALAKAKEITSKEVALAAQKGDIEAINILKDSGKFLGLALAKVAFLLDPTLIILGGGVMQIKGILWTELQKTFAQQFINSKTDIPRLVLAKLKENSCLYGAICLARIKALSK